MEAIKSLEKELEKISSYNRQIQQTERKARELTGAEQEMEILVLNRRQALHELPRPGEINQTHRVSIDRLDHEILEKEKQITSLKKEVKALETNEPEEPEIDPAVLKGVVKDVDRLYANLQDHLEAAREANRALAEFGSNRAVRFSGIDPEIPFRIGKKPIQDELAFTNIQRKPLIDRTIEKFQRQTKQFR